MTSEGTNVVPPPNAKLVASPGATRPMSTAMAPAEAARSTLRLTLQAPRSMSAILPVGLARYESAGDPGEMESAGHPRPTNATLPVTSLVTGANARGAVFAYLPAMDAGELTTSGI